MITIAGTVKEIRGFVSDNLRGAFQELNAVAAGTRAEKAAYHAKIALPEGERFTDEQMQKAVDKLETSLGFEGQPRAVVKPRTQILRFTKNPPPVLGKAAKRKNC